MAFFTGPPSPQNTGDSNSNSLHVNAARGHDDLAQKIGENAERFVRKMWRWEDMQVYVRPSRVLSLSYIVLTGLKDVPAAIGVCEVGERW